MTTANTLRDDLQANIAECAGNICDDFRRQRISTEVAIAVAVCVVSQLLDDLPAEKRAPFIQTYARDLLRTSRFDA